MSRAQFKRAGLGFWGSLCDWTLEFVCCIVLNRHEWKRHDADRRYCERCGIVGPIPRTGV